MDADDSLIGRQVMKLMNALYQISSNWLIYTSFIQAEYPSQDPGYSQEINKEVLARNSYRTEQAWVTSHLRTYLRDLYVKIPKEYFLEEEGKFYFRVSDKFQLYPLVELASGGHIHFVIDILYWYQWVG